MIGVLVGVDRMVLMCCACGEICYVGNCELVVCE